MSYPCDVHITVNGNKCKQYYHQGRTYVEAKDGSEYIIEIKNNGYNRILAVGSVDGLNVLTGDKASEQDSGYLVGGYSSEKIKGFRISDEEWALFKFGFKYNGKTYAQSKKDDSDANCGVIGVRLFYEKPKVVLNQVIPNYYGNLNNYYGGTSGSAAIPLYFSSTATPITYNCSANTVETRGLCQNSNNMLSFFDAGEQDLQAFHGTPKTEPFDMGTEFGRAEKSKVRTVEFERGNLASLFDIYYASRESLIAMGVPITNELKIPNSFPNGYCTPPPGWTR